jgi:hypothetical protein
MHVLRDMTKFQVCMCVVEKTSGSGYEHIRFKDIILKFNDYADAIKYAQKMRKNVCPLHIGR